ncbi:LOW QUALITY PROTEIN: epidermal growth factor receptor pathway substrate 15 [Aphomia sociella]
MAALPSPTQVAGTHSAIYEAYYHQVDPNGTGAIQAPEAARFLKKSQLSDVVLSKIWDLSDPTGKGYLDKPGLFVALKLVALAQAGKDINMSNIHSETPPPKVGEIPKVPPGGMPPRPSLPPHAPPSPAPALPPLSDWSMKPAERDKYSQLFDSLQPNNGLIAGNKVKGMLMESKLPLETLGRIWDLADQDKDGMLDRHEFMVAMHLVYKALEKHAVPTTLPELRARPARPPSRPPRPPSRPPSPQPRPPPRPQQPPPHSNAALLEGLLDLSSVSASCYPPSQCASTGWVVSAAERAEADAQFAAADRDRDGFVSGAEIKHTFLESGLPHHTLAHIWALCDSAGAGKLSRSQFALATWLLRRARNGLPPPAALSPDMVPPDCRAPALAPAQQKIEPVSLGPQPTPEMEAIAREVDALARERLALEAELATKQREITVKSGEADSLESELDTLTATLKQLENQKGEAQKRLNDLKSQVDKLRSQVSAQEAAAAETEAEVAARRAAAQTLRERERALQDEAAAADAEAEAITAQLRRTVLAVSQANIKIQYLEEQLRLMETATAALESGGPAAHAHAALQPQYSQQHLERAVRGATPSDALEDESFPQPEFGSMNGSAAAFAADPFAAAADPFAPSTAANGTSDLQDGFGTDPFASNADPFAGDAFASTDNTKPNKDAGAWEEDPFAVLHAPPRGAPSLPPKAHKTPPPRPAPPRPHPPHKTRANTMDFTEDPFKDYRYEDPFNIEDPFADATDSKKPGAFARPTSVAGFETDDFFGTSPTANGSFPRPEKRSGRVSAPLAYDPFATRSDFKTTAASAFSDTNSNTWAAWPNDNWAADDAWSKPTGQQKDTWTSNTTKNTNSKSTDWKTDNWANKSENWAADWGSDQNKNLNETWPSNTLPSKKEKSPKSVKYAKSLVNTIGGIGRSKHNKEKKSKGASLEARSGELLPTEEQQWAWAAAESKKIEAEVEARRRQEDAELQLALAISRQEK